MNITIVVGRRSVALALALVAACALVAMPAQAKSGPDVALLNAVDRAAPQSTVNPEPVATKGAVEPRQRATGTVTVNSGGAQISNQSRAAVAVPDDRDLPFPRAWLLALVTVLVLVLCDRVRGALKSSKIDNHSLRSNAMTTPFVRN